jgi:hypothetical protein
MAKFDQFNNTLGASGNFKLQVTNAGGGTTVPINRPCRLVRILVSVGTGQIQVWDSNSTTPAGVPDWQQAASTVGQVVLIDDPLSVGLALTLGAGMTVTLVYS